IALTAYSPLGSDNSPLLSDPTVTKIANKHGVHPARILVSLWANVDGVTGKSPPKPALPCLATDSVESSPRAVLPKSVKNARIAENIKAIELSTEEVAELLAVGKRIKFRACNPTWTGWGNLGFPDVKA
ncbi:hypothetical protein FRC06_003137, partial [Ceratobasidium sp. 370]